MKNLLIFFTLFLLSPFQSFSQDNQALDIPLDPETRIITYQEVVQEEGIKDTLFNRGASWLHKFFSNPWEVTRVRDQATGVIKGQHQFRLYDIDATGIKTDAGMVMYNFKLEFKENRYRYTLDNFIWKQVSRYLVEKWLDKSSPDYNIKYENYLRQIDSFVRNEFIKSLKEGMKPGIKFKKDEW
jgi:hypothetical protein